MAEFLINVTRQSVSLYLGLHEFEKRTPQRVLISVQIVTTDLGGDAASFVDYDPIVAHIRTFEGRHIETQEELVLLLHRFVCAQDGVARARVSSQKPDIFEDVEAVGLSYPATPLFA